MIRTESNPKEEWPLDKQFWCAGQTIGQRALDVDTPQSGRNGRRGEESKAERARDGFSVVLKR